MANEEMEVSIELGRHDLIEDIDIDFEFGAQHDEDLELGDYDQTDEYQHFNSDNRDELMAEDDDASYGMADADDINSNENTTAGNDYDIAIGDADVYTWPEDEVVNDSEGRQVEQVEESASSNTEGTNIGTTTVANSLLHTEVAIVEPEAGQASLNAVGERSTINADEHSTETHDFEDAFSNPAEGNIVQEVTSEVLIESGRDQKLDGTEALQFATTESTEASNSNLKDETHIASGQSGSVDVQLSPAQTNDDEGENVAADDDEIGYDQFEEEQGSTEEAAAPVTASDNDLTNARETRQQDDDAEDEKPADEGDGEFTAEEYQLGDSSFERVDAHNGAEADVLEYRSVSPTMNDQSGIATPANDELEGTDNANSNNVTGDAATIAKRHVMVVHYGETDYQLFADNSDDDPSNFFFKDLSALSLPLGEFLSGIRGVIAEEVSPLDELVLHIDGLGLEFSESMTSNVLDGYTFAHVVSLYDSLVQNDAGDKSVDPPELYMYLMVRPNCLQRLIALQVQADSGRGLTDVAVYREASPAEGANDVSRGDDMLSITPDFVEEELYDDDEDVSEEGRFSQENTNDIEGEAETTELDAQATELAEDSPHHDSDYAEETEEIADDGLGDVLDYDNLDLTPPQQDPVSNTTNGTSSPHNATAALDNGRHHEDLGTAANGGQPNVAHSESTSATATLDGESSDKLNYDENDLGVNHDDDVPSISMTLMPPIDEEITWESENEEGRTEQSQVPKSSERVSTTPGKRTRSDSGVTALATGRKDVKRQRS